MEKITHSGRSPVFSPSIFGPRYRPSNCWIIKIKIAQKMTFTGLTIKMTTPPITPPMYGPNGSGKSTITTFFDKVGKYTNADDVVAATGMDNMEAAVLVDKMRYESISKKEDFTFETVLSSEYKLNILRKAKEEGYFIKCVFVLTVDPQINIARIESRVAAGGHDVDSRKVVERYYKSINNIKELLNICDIMHVYDNTKTPERIIRKHKDELSIYPNEYWTEQDILGLME